jgi:hypothetical protein
MCSRGAEVNKNDKSLKISPERPIRLISPWCGTAKFLPIRGLVAESCRCEARKRLKARGTRLAVFLLSQGRDCSARIRLHGANGNSRAGAGGCFGRWGVLRRSGPGTGGTAGCGVRGCGWAEGDAERSDPGWVLVAERYRNGWGGQSLASGGCCGISIRYCRSRAWASNRGSAAD